MFVSFNSVVVDSCTIFVTIFGWSSISSPVPVLLVREDIDKDDIVGGDDEDEGEISTSVDSSSSSIPANGKIVVFVVVILAAAVLVAFVDSMLIVLLLCASGLSQVFPTALFSHPLCL